MFIPAVKMCWEHRQRMYFYCTIKLFWFLICKLQKNRLKRVHNRIDLEDLQWIIIATIILANLLISLFKLYNRIYWLTWKKKKIMLMNEIIFVNYILSELQSIAWSIKYKINYITQKLIWNNIPLLVLRDTSKNIPHKEIDY